MRHAAHSTLSLWLTLCLGVTVALAGSNEPKPYLAPEAEPDELILLPAPPADGTPVAHSEHELFTATRSLAGTARWSLALADNDRAPKSVWEDFACALGDTIPADRVPTVIDLVGRLNADVELATRAVKAHYRRARPLVGNDATLCVPRTDKLVESYSFPSGHAMQGWATALVLAELAPDRATPLLQRGRVFGDSRVVCGAHWASDIEAGRKAGAVLVAVLHGNADFRRDLDQARTEIFAARQGEALVPDAALCHVGAEAAAHPLAE